MDKNPDFEEILKKNPHIKKKDLKKNMSLAEELRKMGVMPRGYQLAPPFARHRAKSGEVEELDPRTINLTASRH